MSKTPWLILVVAACSGLFGEQVSFAAGRYSLGHADVRAYYEAGELKLRYQLSGGALVDGAPVDPITGTEAVSFGLNELVTWIPDVSIPLPPGDTRFDFLGAAPDASVWLIPEGGTEAESLGLPWLGFSTEELVHEDWKGFDDHGVHSGLLRLDLLSVEGPAGAHLSMFYSPQDELTTPVVHFASSDGIDATDTYRSSDGLIEGLPTSTHSHVNWVFTEPGEYDVTLKFSGTHLVDGYKEAIGTVRFAVAVPEPSTLGMLAGSGIVAAGFLRRRWGKRT
jgi:surface-anchored protein